MSEEPKGFTDELDGMDQLLRKTMSAPAPVLPPNFERNLERKINARPPRLASTGQRVLSIYALATLLISILAMRVAGVDWPWIALAITAPAMVSGMLVWVLRIRWIRPVREQRQR
jgi:hypothetical protein